MATALRDYESHYERLEVHPECTRSEIREAWLRLSMQHHPDLNPGDETASARFQEIKESYKVLINDEARKLYNDQIGFHHSDPPPQYHREWTLQGERTRAQARAYNMWSEEKIRELMSSARLREVNWDRQTPAERYNLLMEENKRRGGTKALLEEIDTPTLREGKERYGLMVAVVVVLHTLLVIYSRDELKEEYSVRDLDRLHPHHLESQSGVVLDRNCLKNYDVDRHPLQMPGKPDRYWINPHWQDE